MSPERRRGAACSQLAPGLEGATQLGPWSLSWRRVARLTTLLCGGWRRPSPRSRHLGDRSLLMREDGAANIGIIPAMRALTCVLGYGLVATAIVLVPARAQAAASARLVYVRGPGAEECPGENAVRAAVGARLGYDPFFAWAHDTLIAELSRAGGEFRIDLKLVDEHNTLRGARQMSVTGTDCATAIDAMGLTMSLAIDPSSLVSPQPAPPATPAPPPEVPQAEVMTAPPPAESPRPRAPATRPQSISGRAGLGALGSVGAAPVATVGAVAFAGLSWRMLSVDLEGRADLPATGAGQGTPARVRSWLVAGSVVPCTHLGLSFGCFVLSGGSVGATSAGTAVPRTAHAPWWAMGARGGAEVPLGGALSLRAYAELLAIATRDSLSIDGAVAYTFAPWSVGLGADLAWRFP
jgi:hypothetical protein